MALVLENTVLAVLFFILTSVQVSIGEVHKVGDSAGWTTIGNVDYKQWSATKNFQIGDVIVFEYNPQFHNVMQVTHAEYKSCNASSPISTHTTGNDSITINTHGHHFFMCAVPGHCQAGQKVDINVLRSPSVAPSPSPLSSPVHTVPAPSPNAARFSALNKPFEKLGWLLLVLQLLFVVS
ncbi:mavicyanin-like [Olea europaea var. sylvestris]|uniref:Mavicyanin-like n=1 Tax=Olea europaea subsp. europaea TaxID=158383 RepID=A0A8S0TP81_OLEEU|nr:mavicyanin-like [Olea europaea var. sylvestris]CAA3007790.1 mavicyanin-like [Olea europaea subsp. europaea]